MTEQKKLLECIWHYFKRQREEEKETYDWN